jgi:dCTP diphosphatase
MNDHDRFAEVKQQLREFVAERDWEQFHSAKNLAMAIASEAGELLAPLRWVSLEESDALVRSSERRKEIEEEVADIAIALFLFCDRAGIDLLEAVSSKVEINRVNYPAERSKGRAERP